MRNKLIPAMLTMTGLVMLHACAWVELTPEGNKVRVLSAQEVSSCKHLGSTTATVKDDVAGMKRQAHIVQENLETLARNAAAKMGGDTIVPQNAPKFGKQTFKVYRCVGN